MRVSDQKNQSPLAIQLRAYMSENNLSQVSVAKSIGLTSSVISAWLGNKYAGDVVGVEEKIRQHLVLEESRSERPALPDTLIETKALCDITASLKIAARDYDMIVVTGPSGAGKTTTLKEFARSHAAAILIEADPGYTSMALFAELCERLGLPAKGSLHDLLQRVVEKLQGSGRLIIIDEAEQLPYKALELIRRVHDKAGVPVALVGMPRLRKNLQGDHNHYAQLWSRIGFHRAVGLLTPRDEESFIRSKLGDVPRDVLDLLRKECGHNARVLVKLMRWCSELTRLNDRPLSVETVTEAVELVSVA